MISPNEKLSEPSKRHQNNLSPFDQSTPIDQQLPGTTSSS